MGTPPAKRSWEQPDEEGPVDYRKVFLWESSGVQAYRPYGEFETKNGPFKWSWVEYRANAAYVAIFGVFLPQASP